MTRVTSKVDAVEDLVRFLYRELREEFPHLCSVWVDWGVDRDVFSLVVYATTQEDGKEPVVSAFRSLHPVNMVLDMVPAALLAWARRWFEKSEMGLKAHAEKKGYRLLTRAEALVASRVRR